MKHLFLSLSVIVSIFGCSDSRNQQEDALVEAISNVQNQNIELNNWGKIEITYRMFELKSHLRRNDFSKGYTSLKFICDQLLLADSLSKNMIHVIDSMKVELLRLNNVSLKLVDTTCHPVKIDLSGISNSVLNRNVSYYFLDEQKRAKHLFIALKRFRNELTKKMGTYTFHDSHYEITPISINDYTSEKKLRRRVEKMVDASKANLKEERYFLIDLYTILSFPNKIEGTPWSIHEFEDIDLLSALAKLTNIQNKIMEGKRLALSCFLYKGCFDSYSFDKILPVTNGPTTAYEGDTIELTVYFGVVDSFSDPIIELSNQIGKIHYPGDGTGRVRVKIGKGIQYLKGKISIQNKSGVMKTEEWNYTLNGVEHL